MILLPGEGIDDAQILLSCPSCEERIPVPSGSIRNLIKKIHSRKLRTDSDNLPFKYHRSAINDKKRMQARELVYLREELHEAADLKEYAELTRMYIKKQRRYLMTLREVSNVCRIMGELVEEVTDEYSSVVNKIMKRNYWAESDFEDIREKCETLQEENRNFKRYREAAHMTSVFKTTSHTLLT